MNNPFDKIYVLSMITNESRQRFITEQFNELVLDFEFVYGIDFCNFTYDASNNPIEYPNMYEEGPGGKKVGNYGCSITHYRAVRQAIRFGYNKILIIEDDICFIKNKELIQSCFDNIPEDADFITWDPRFINLHKKNELFEFTDFMMRAKHQNKMFVNIPNNLTYMCGGMMYALMNPNTIQLYVNSQHIRFEMSDRVKGIWDDPVCNRYASTNCLCADQYNILHNFNHNIPWYWNTYHILDHSISSDNFFVPKEYLASNRELSMNDPNYVEPSIITT